MIQLPNNKKCYNLPEQVAQNLANITYLAEEYKNIDELPAIWQSYKETFDAEQETFAGWTTTFEGWDTTLATYLVNMSSAAVSAIAGQNIAPANINATGTVDGNKITGNEIVEKMAGYGFYTEADINITKNTLYAGVVKNGNKITFCVFTEIKRTGTADSVTMGFFNIPTAIGDKLFPAFGTYLEMKEVYCGETYNAGVAVKGLVTKPYNNLLRFNLYGVGDLTLNTTYYARFEVTFLLSNNLAE